jgi:ATPase, YjeE family
VSFDYSQVHQINNLPELKRFWESFVPHLEPRTILLLNGDVGAGKTTSVQFIAEILGLKNVQSPSFAIHLRYENPNGRGLDHIDLYRLKDEDDLESSGFWDIFAQREGLVIIEWSQRLDVDYLPLNWERIEVVIKKSPLSEDTRIITTRLV